MKYRICSRTELPLRFKGIFDYDVAYIMICEWNQRHRAEDMASLEPMGPVPPCEAVMRPWYR